MSFFSHFLEVQKNVNVRELFHEKTFLRKLFSKSCQASLEACFRRQNTSYKNIFSRIASICAKENYGSLLEFCDLGLEKSELQMKIFASS